MTTYLLIGGPKHGQAVNVLHGKSVRFPGWSPPPDWQASAQDPLPQLHPDHAYYKVWDLSPYWPTNRPHFEPLMKLVGLEDLDAIKLLVQWALPRISDVELTNPTSAGWVEFRMFLDQWADRPLPGGVHKMLTG